MESPQLAAKCVLRGPRLPRLLLPQRLTLIGLWVLFELLDAEPSGLTQDVGERGDSLHVQRLASLVQQALGLGQIGERPLFACQNLCPRASCSNSVFLRAV